MQEPHDHIPPSLSKADADAVDALFDAGFDPARLEALPLDAQARAAQARAVLDLLDPVGHASLGGRLLTDVTFARVLRAAAKAPAAAPDHESLCRADADAVDALVDTGWDARRAPAKVAPRAVRWADLVRPLDRPAAAVLTGAEKAALVEATLARVQRAIDVSERRLTIQTSELGDGRRSRFTLSDLASVAAMIVFAFGVLWPMASAWREESRRLACQANLGNAAVGFAGYANDHRGSLPVAAAGYSGSAGPWWNVGQPRGSHSANLFALVSGGYTPLASLTCPGNTTAPLDLDPAHHHDWRAPEEVSFSYQLPPANRQRWNLGPTTVVVLADKSPVIDRARRGERFDPLARSLNHRGRGQSVLFSDGSVLFLHDPVLPTGDNIWLPRSAAANPRPELRGVERPESEDDAFVAP